MLNVAVLVSGGGTNLQALIDAQKSGIITSGEIKLVISNKSDAYALTRASTAGIDTAVVLKKECKEEVAINICGGFVEKFIQKRSNSCQ